jgi:hypothetical protein
MTRWMRLRRSMSTAALLAAGLMFAWSSGPARADELLDPVGDLLPTYSGPHDPGLDVVAHEVTFMGDRLVLSGRMAGPIAPTQAIGGLYLFGLDRGQGTPRFRAGTPVIGPNVLWDLIVRINPNGTGLVNNQVAGVVTPLNPADIHISGNEFTASVPLALLMPAATRPPLEWTYNLWPRNGIVPGQNQHVSDLAPDDGNSPVQLPPEPPSPTPFKGRLGGNVVRTPAPPLVRVDVVATGNATHLGRFTLEIPHLVDPAVRLAFGSYQFTAANGDMLLAHFAGQSSLTEIPGVLYIVETAVIEDGTGRFAGASGSFVSERWFDTSTGTTLGTFDGAISSPGASKP